LKEMQVSFKWRSRRKIAASASPSVGKRTLAELRTGERGILESLDLPEDIARRLMELGFLPGHAVTPAQSAPGGDPRVFRIDGSEVALRRDMAAHLWVRTA
jgi:ferrous iron transport protein A